MTPKQTKTTNNATPETDAISLTDGAAQLMHSYYIKCKELEVDRNRLMQENTLLRSVTVLHRGKSAMPEIINALDRLSAAASALEKAKEVIEYIVGGGDWRRSYLKETILPAISKAIDAINKR